MQIQPYLFFDGRCEEAIGFYQQAIGATAEMMLRYKEAPENRPDMHPGYGDKIMHANLRIGDSTVLMSDDCISHPGFEGFSLALVADSEADAEKKFSALAAGGQVSMPLTKTFFSPAYGMLVDKFGVHWMVLAR